MPGIRDRVAVLGVGCTKFGERWEMDAEDLLVDAVYEAYDDAGIDREEIEAAWIGTLYNGSGMTGCAVADPLKWFGKPATRVENACATGMEAFRNACFAVASGVYDIALACGVEKILDAGSRGLPGVGEMGHPVIGAGVSAPGMFAMMATRCFKEYGWSKEDLARVAVKNHHNGTKHPKAHFRKEITIDDVLKAPIIAWPLGRYDCCAISDGSAAVVVTTPEKAKEYKHKDDFIVTKSNTISVHTMMPMYQPGYEFLGFPATQDGSKVAYAEAGVKDPKKEIGFAEVHDCFMISELLHYQDLGFCEKGEGASYLKDGVFDIDGDLPVNPSGGLKCFGHPIGATGCRMIYELTKQLQGRADGYQVENEEHKYGLAYNLGGVGSICSISILGMP